MVSAAAPLDLTIRDQGLQDRGTINLDGVEGAVEISQGFDEAFGLRFNLAPVPSDKVGLFIPRRKVSWMGLSRGVLNIHLKQGKMAA